MLHVKYTSILVFVLFARSIPYSILLFLKEYLYWTALSRLHWLARRPKSTRSVNEAASAFPHKRRYSLFGYWININKSDINYKTDFISGHWDKLSSIIGNNFSKAITFIHYPLLSSQYPIPWDVISSCSKINNTVSPSKQFLGQHHLLFSDLQLTTLLHIIFVKFLSLYNFIPARCSFEIALYRYFT